MRAELQLFNAVCDNKDIQSILGPDVERMITSKDVYKTIVGYYHKYGRAPDFQIVQDKHSDLPDVDTGADTKFYVDELRNEYINNKMREIISSNANNGRAPTDTLNKLTSDLTVLARDANIIRDVNITDVDDAVDDYKARKKLADERGGTPGITTGIKYFDDAYPTGLAGGHLIVVIGWSGFGKASALDEDIPTPTGTRKFGDLRVGDKVYGPYGDERSVIQLHPVINTGAHEVTFTDGTSTVVHANHLWNVMTPKHRQNKTGVYKTMSTQEILDAGVWRERPDLPNNNGEARWFLPLPEPVEHDDAELPVAPYALGAMLGDGSMTHATGYLCSNDEEIVEKCRRDTGWELPERTYETSTVRYWAVFAKDKTGFVELDIWGKYSHEKRIPERYYLGSVEQRYELLRGLMDTDGGGPYGVCRGRANFFSNNKLLAGDVARLVRSLGGVAKLYTVHRNERQTDEYRVAIWTAQNPYYLSRKAATYDNDGWFKAIRSIEPVQDRPMRCITVDAADGLYLMKDYTVTHNSLFSAYLACKAWEQGYKPMIVSLEMSPEQVRDRIYTMLASGAFSNKAMSRGQIDIDSFQAWGKKNIEDQQDFIVVSSEGQSAVTPMMVQSKIDQYQPDLVVADYQQLFDAADSNGGNETVKNKIISREFKRIAVKNNIPFINLSQATQSDVTDLEDPPLIQQVAWSKSIQHDSDLAIAVHKPPETDTMEVIARKNRHGNLFLFWIDMDIDKGIWTPTLPSMPDDTEAEGEWEDV